MTLPNQADPDTYGMPSGGWSDYDPLVDPTTDVASAGGNNFIADVAGMTHTARRCWARFVGGTSPTLATSNSNGAVWGEGAPPTPAHSSTGVYTMTFPTTITDAMGVTYPVNLRWAKASVEGSTAYWNPQCTVSGNVITIYTFNSSASPNDLSGVTIFVEAG
jgi:hypothetical protein